MTMLTHTRFHRPARRKILGAFARMLATRKQRRDLARLDDAALEDIGLTRRQATEEARRLLWDAPETWRS